MSHNRGGTRRCDRGGPCDRRLPFVFEFRRVAILGKRVSRRVSPAVSFHVLIASPLRDATRTLFRSPTVKNFFTIIIIRLILCWCFRATRERTSKPRLHLFKKKFNDEVCVLDNFPNKKILGWEKWLTTLISKSTHRECEATFWRAEGRRSPARELFSSIPCVYRRARFARGEPEHNEREARIGP